MSLKERPGAPTPHGRNGALKLATTILAVTLALAITAASSAQSNHPPVSFVEQALCIHSGWHFTSHRLRGKPAEYVLWGHGYWRTWNVPDTTRGGSGEGSWTANTGNGYHGGFQFLTSTWQRAGGRGAAEQASPSEQIYRAWMIWRSHRGSWSEWGWTKDACGYR